MMNETSSSPRGRISNVLSGVLGGLVVLVAGAVLIATDTIDTGDTTTQVIRGNAVATQPVANAADGASRTVSDIYEQEGKGVVFVQAEGVTQASDSPFGPEQQDGTATGSGFVVDGDGTIVTNAHVVEGSENISVRFGENGDFIDARVVGRDPSTDIAILKIDPDAAELEPIPLGDSSEAQVGDAVVAIGNPFGFTRTVTTGIVSAKQRQIEAPNGFPIRNVIQTDAAINPGNSGGPLLDAGGNVVGINSQIATDGSNGSVGIGFAVPVDTLKELLPQLREGGDIERAYLGVSMAEVTGELARELDLAVENGALVTEVVAGGPADDGGLRGGRTPTGEGIVAGGDLLVKVDGENIGTPDDVAAAIADNAPGDEVRIEYFRGDERETATVELANRPASLEAARQGQGGGGEDLFPELP